MKATKEKYDKGIYIVNLTLSTGQVEGTIRKHKVMVRTSVRTKKTYKQVPVCLLQWCSHSLQGTTLDCFNRVFECSIRAFRFYKVFHCQGTTNSWVGLGPT